MGVSGWEFLVEFELGTKLAVVGCLQKGSPPRLSQAQCGPCCNDVEPLTPIWAYMATQRAQHYPSASS